ncbi:MAG TPA: hypothetical protein VLJ88_17355 [Propionibacteriaceae bacterium]|nr:hypothetical protein [Propionibacteriaceae bacterium]
MYINSTLVSEFDRATASVRPGDLDLPAVVQRLDAAATHAVPSLLGWRLTVRVDGANVTLTSVQPSMRNAVVRASFRIPLTALDPAALDGRMVFYASAPYAFSRLNREFLPAICTGRRQAGMDQDLNPDLGCGLSGVRPTSTRNRSTQARVHQAA